MRFTDNAELTAPNMENADILAGTDVSTSTDKKFTLSGLADWLLNRFTGLSLAGSNQSVKAALDGLNSNLGNLSVFSLSTSLRFTSDPAAFLMSVWDQLPNTDRTPCIVSITGTGGAVMCFAYRYSTGYGGAYMMHYSGTCGVVTVNSGTATWHAI